MNWVCRDMPFATEMESDVLLKEACLGCLPITEDYPVEIFFTLPNFVKVKSFM